MASQPATKPVRDSVAKVDHEVAVGEDLQFQRKWWRFETIAWVTFTVIIILDLAGLFGRGPLANSEVRSPDGTIDVKYERIERNLTPSILTIQFGPAAIQDQKIRLFISNSLVKGLGAQRVIPAPLETSVGQNGLTYTFPASSPPATVELALEPNGPGSERFTIGVVGAAPVHGRVFIVP